MEVKKPEIDIDIEVEVLEERIAPGVNGSFAFSLRTHAGLRSIRVDNHAAAGIRRAGAVSGTICSAKCSPDLPPIIIGRP